MHVRGSGSQLCQNLRMTTQNATSGVGCILFYTSIGLNQAGDTLAVFRITWSFRAK